MALTLVIGFAFLDWHTSDTVRAKAKDAARVAPADLAAAICVQRFLEAPDRAGRISELRAQTHVSQDGFLEQGGWIVFGRARDPIHEAADICADRLLDLDLPDGPDAAAIAES